MRHYHSQGRFAAYLIEWLISESVFSLHYLPCGSAWLHRWTDCSTQGDAFRNFQLPLLESEHWHWCVRFTPNGLHFLSLALQWCWNQPLSRKVAVAVVGGDGWWLVSEVETRVNLMSRPEDLFMSLQWPADEEKSSLFVTWRSQINFHKLVPRPSISRKDLLGWVWCFSFISSIFTRQNYCLEVNLSLKLNFYL